MTSRLVLALACATATASAQPVDPAEAAYQEGRRLYDLREFSDAIAKFKEAYRLRPDAKSLFNIAQSYRLSGDCPNAFATYKTFQRNFPAERADAVAKFLTELEPCSKDAPKPPAPTPATPVTEPPPAAVVTTPPPATRPAETPRGRGMRLTGLAVGGLGAVAIGTGIYFGMSARSTSQEVADSDTWNPSLDETARRHDRNAKLLLVAGGVMAIGGAVLFTVGTRQASSTSVAIVPEEGGATFVWSGGF